LDGSCNEHRTCKCKRDCELRGLDRHRTFGRSSSTRQR
jgi:hypothetical protein